MNMKNKFSLLTIALFVCAASAWAEPRLVAQERHAGNVEKLKYTADGNFLLSVDSTSAKVWDAKSGMLIRSFKVRSLMFRERDDCDISPDGHYFIYISPEGFFKKADVLTGSEIDVFQGGIDNTFSGVAYSQNGFFYAIALNSKDVNIYNAKTDKLIYQLNTKDFSGSTIAFACEENSKEDGTGTRLIKIGSDGKLAVAGYNIYDGKPLFLIQSCWA